MSSQWSNRSSQPFATWKYAAEEGQHLEFMTYVADSFGAQQGSMDRREFHRFMIFQINQNRRLQAQFFPDLCHRDR